MIGLLGLFGAAFSPAADLQMERMTALYEDVCLKAFPNDKAVEAAMRSRKARGLTPEEVRVTMRDDPGRGWELQDKSASVWLEFPPYHACSVRWNASELGDLAPYRAVTRSYQEQQGGFVPMKTMERDMGDINVRAIGERRRLANGSWETMYVFDQHITDAKRRAAGETGYVLRFVHQFRSADVAE